MRDLAKVSKRNPRTAYTVLGVSLQLELKYLQRNILGIGALIEAIEAALRKDFSLPSLEKRRWMTTSEIFWDT